jgi:hypothetical protein
MPHYTDVLGITPIQALRWVGGEPQMRLLLIIAVILVLTLVLFGAGALDDVANVIIQILSWTLAICRRKE